MSKTKEELKQLKIEYESFNKKLKDLSDDEIKEVTGGKIISIIPQQTDHSNLFQTNNIPDDLGLINKKPAGNVEFQNAEVKGSVSNHNDQSNHNKFIPPLK